MRSKDQILLENLYSQILNEINNDEEFDKEFENFRNRLSNISDGIKDVFNKDIRLAEIPDDFDFTVENGVEKVMFPEVSFFSDININIDRSIEDQINEIETIIDKFIKMKNYGGVEFSVNHSADTQSVPDEIERIGTGNEWIGVSLIVPSRNLTIEIGLVEWYLDVLKQINNFLLSLTNRFIQ
jgi:hypothetical protein